MYSCAKCGATVVLVDGAAVRNCDHEGEGIIASIAAKTVGVGTADPPADPAPETSADEAGQP